ncbi:unnamed protein product [Cuscuta campestris]|uniref:Protein DETOXIFICATION n=1 Tax=Cuscuta campestris TaxID=132261 RepID=A0A484MFC0_9ASTE|nr:unnamed protein product [Cuscuta campestris]
MDSLPDDLQEQLLLQRWPTFTEAIEEVKAIGKISGPTALTGLLLYSRAFTSMLFLGRLGSLELAAGSLSVGFANITGYSVLTGLALGMEPICGQAHGAKQTALLGLTLQRTVLLLLSAAVPISFLWLNMYRILLWCGQDEKISAVAGNFIVMAIPDLYVLSLLHPLRIFLRMQGVTLPVTSCSAASVILHIPLNILLVRHLKMGVAGVAVAMVLTNLNLFIFLSFCIYLSEKYRDCFCHVAVSRECFKGWSTLLTMAVPTCVSVCLEWWWYELMVMLCGLLVNPRATLSSMGILIQTTSFLYIFPSALGLGVSTRVGNELGASRPARARTSTIVSMVWAFGLGAAAIAFTTLMRHQWAGIFTADVEVLELTAAALPIVGLCELGNCPQTTGCGVLRGTARPAVGANINLGSFYAVGMPVAVVLGFATKMGFAGLWLGLLAAEASCAALMLIVLWRTDWKVQVERAKQLTNQSSSSSSSSTLDDDHPIMMNTGEKEVYKRLCDEEALVRKAGLKVTCFCNVWVGVKSIRDVVSDPEMAELKRSAFGNFFKFGGIKYVNGQLLKMAEFLMMGCDVGDMDEHEIVAYRKKMTVELLAYPAV